MELSPNANSQGNLVSVVTVQTQLILDLVWQGSARLEICCVPGSGSSKCTMEIPLGSAAVKILSLFKSSLWEGGVIWESLLAVL